MGAQSSPEHRAKLSELAQAITKAGWSGQDAKTALAISLTESGGDPRAVSSSGKYKGAWQLSPDHPVNPFDLERSTAYAYGLWRKAGFQPWGAYSSGRYRRALPLASEIMEIV